MPPFKAPASHDTYAAQRSALLWSLVCVFLAGSYFGLDFVIGRFKKSATLPLSSSRLEESASQSRSPQTATSINVPREERETGALPRAARVAEPAPGEAAPASTERTAVEAEWQNPGPSELTPSSQEVTIDAVAADPLNRALIQEFLGRASSTPDGVADIEKLKALALETPSSTLAEELADYLKSIGETEEAVDWYQRALEKNPPNPEEIRAMIGVSQQVISRDRSQQGQM